MRPGAMPEWREQSGIQSPPAPHTHVLHGKSLVSAGVLDMGAHKLCRPVSRTALRGYKGRRDKRPPPGTPPPARASSRATQGHPLLV